MQTHILRACATALAGFLTAWLLLTHASAQVYDYTSSYYNYYPTSSTYYPTTPYTYPYSYDYNYQTTYPTNYDSTYNTYAYTYDSYNNNFYNSNSYSSSSDNWSTSCGALRFNCTNGSIARCVNSNWACYRPNDTSYLNTNTTIYRGTNIFYTGSVTRRTDPCRNIAPNCGSWTLRCTSDGWRCDRPAATTVYPYDSYDSYNSYNNYSYPYMTNSANSYPYNNNYNYGYDSCAPQTACSGPNAYCPAGTVCSMYRQGYACVPTNCGVNYNW